MPSAAARRAREQVDDDVEREREVADVPVVVRSVRITRINKVIIVVVVIISSFSSSSSFIIVVVVVVVIISSSRVVVVVVVVTVVARTLST